MRVDRADGGSACARISALSREYPGSARRAAITERMISSLSLRVSAFADDCAFLPGYEVLRMFNEGTTYGHWHQPLKCSYTAYSIGPHGVELV